ncbi:MAG: tRNA threonylcarbamoyladenosine biosynthesis protein RimN [Gammaproteobacteria bacterium]|nr:MAG: tRNA threonylcarbamoyladenosine biosynthesis protein RimN [Gammaproteobacteria bacterium]
MSKYRIHSIKAVNCLKKIGGVIAYPTEAVFGLGCNPFDEDAINKIMAIKSRSLRKGVIVIASDSSQITPFIKPLFHLGQKRKQEILASWPGANTWILPAKPSIPKWLTGEHDTIAIRITNHPVAKEICRFYKGAIVSTSANHHGYTPAVTAMECHRYLKIKPDYIHPGKVGNNSKPSSIRDGISGKVLR